MKIKLKLLIPFYKLGVLGLVLGNSYPLSANSPDPAQIPTEVMNEIFSYLNRKDLGASRVNHWTDDILAKAYPKHWSRSGRKFKKLFKKVEQLLELDQFIPIENPSTWKLWKKHPNSSISPIGVTQELWFTLMGNNPSSFNKQRYCPDTYLELNGVSLCPDFPVDSVQRTSMGKKNSSQEFLNRLNRLYQSQGLPIHFREATAEEFEWADSEGGKKPKQMDDPDLWKYVTYWDISDKDPLDRSRPSPSGDHQNHSVRAKLPNSFGFYRSGVWEWIETPRESSEYFLGWKGFLSWFQIPDTSFPRTHFLMGGSIEIDPRNSVSGVRRRSFTQFQSNNQGASRLVKVQLN